MNTGESPEIKDLQHEMVANVFGFHPASAESRPLHEETRKRFAELGHWLIDNIPSCRERSLAITNLQESAMFTNAAIAINLAPLE